MTLQLILAVSMAIFGCVMIVAAFIVPPTGEIHPSVLTAFGEILTFAGAVLGIDYNYKFKTRLGSPKGVENSFWGEEEVRRAKRAERVSSTQATDDDKEVEDEDNQ